MRRLFHLSFNRLIVLIAAVTLLAGVPRAAAAGSYFTYAGYTFAVSGQNAIISEYEGTDMKLYIPQSIFGYTVVGIEDSAFFGRDDFFSVNMTDAADLRTIGDYAFYQCSGLSAVKLPDAVESIGTAAFMNCSAIETLSLSKRITRIPDRAFCNCSSLSEVQLPDSVTSLGAYSFSGCSALSKVMIPESVSSISSTAFQNDEQLVIYCRTGSYAHSFAESGGYRYVLLDAPSEPPTDEPTESLGYYLGDVDANGIIEAVDVTYIQRFGASFELPFMMDFRRSDIDSDGDVTVVDASLIQCFLAKMDIDYPIGIQP
ncbi:MAG: leucine-rich repeat protein [Ruminococcus sp.]|nr:leucine-rich repeat protein [Ruminococcus sp.]